MANCALCGRAGVTGHNYCTLQCKRAEATEVATLTRLIADGNNGSGKVTNASSLLATKNGAGHIGSLTPPGDGSEPY